MYKPGLGCRPFSWQNKEWKDGKVCDVETFHDSSCHAGYAHTEQMGSSIVFEPLMQRCSKTFPLVCCSFNIRTAWSRSTNTHIYIHTYTPGCVWERRGEGWGWVWRLFEPKYISYSPSRTTHYFSLLFCPHPTPTLGLSLSLSVSRSLSLCIKDNVSSCNNMGWDDPSSSSLGQQNDLPH